MNNRIAIYFCVTFAALAVIESISVVGPRVLRPFGSYRVAIAGGSRPYSLYVAVEGRRANGEQFTQGREVQVQAAASRIIELEIGDPGPGRYALVARSTSGPLFSSSAPLAYQPRSFCVFVQTDKRVYQPGDTINFRVIALDKYLRPLSGAVDINVVDDKGSPIRQWVGASLDRGLITEELMLADEPSLGEWTIQVETRGQTYSKKILIADYVLPKFNLEMNMPKEILFSDGRFNINVTAKHFNGQPVRGELTISSYAIFFSGLLQPVVSSPSRKVVNIEGHAEVTYDLKTDLDLAEDAARPLVVEAVLEEKDTLIRQNISSTILLLRTPYRLKVTAPEFFKPTLPYNVQIEVVDSSGQVMETEGEVSVERLWDDGAPVNVTIVALKKGRATYVLVPDAAHFRSTLNLVIKYKEVTDRVVNVVSSEYTDGQFLTIELLTSGSSNEEDIRARVSSTKPMDLLHYVVVAKGDILVSKTLELNPARRSVDISAAVGDRAAPGCVVAAWYPRLSAANASLIAAALYAPRTELLHHTVSLSPVAATGLSPKPNSLVELKVSGAAGAVVAVLGADSNAVALGLAAANGLGDGLDLQTIEREVESFSGLKHSIFNNEAHHPNMGIDLGGYRNVDVFKNAGLVILTDGVVEHNTNEDAMQAIETGTRPPLAGPYAFSRLPVPPSPRYYLTTTTQPTWMLANFTINNEGQGTKERWTPTAPAELTVGAFAIHPTLGLALASPQKFATTVPLSISAELPATLQRGEALVAVIILKNSLSVATSVEVTFYNNDQYFEFEPLDNNLDSIKKIELFRRERLTIPAKGSASTAFLVTAVRSGEAPIIVEASGNGVSDSLFRTIDVKDGYEEDLFTWNLLDARRSVARTNVSLIPPAGVKPGPISLMATGDLLSSAMYAARLPPAAAGDPPHAVRPLAAGCVLLDYLQATAQEDAAISKDARALVAVGYQRLMAYRRPDGSFAPETDQEPEGDVWMTSVALRWLSRCARYLPVSPMASNTAATWLAHTQKEEGSWPVPLPGLRNDPRAQSPIPQAAYALVALLQIKGGELLYKDNILRAQEYITRNISPSLDAYTLALISGALAAAKNTQSTLALQIMDKYANTTGSTLYWSRQISGSEWRNPWLKGNSVEATTAAWALRGMLAGRLVEEAVPVVKYLLQAYKPVDPDPDVIDAIAQFAETIKTSTKLRVSFNVTGSDETRQFQIGENNALIIHTQSIRNSRSASVATEGRGIALVGLSAKGSTNVTAAWPRYTLDPRVDQVSTKYRLQLSICYGFVGQGNETESGLVLLTVQLPSGYLADINTLTELTSVRHVVSARLQRGGSRVVSWVRAARGERCATLAAPRALPVARQRPGWATLNDLYDSSHRARQFFQPVPSTACDVCRLWDSCSKACGATAQQRAPDTTGSGKGITKPAPDAAATRKIVPITLVLAAIVALL